MRLRQNSRVSKEKRDTGTINNLMDTTFPHRRQKLITDVEKLSEVIDLYPNLCDEEQGCCKCNFIHILYIYTFFFTILYIF